MKFNIEPIAACHAQAVIEIFNHFIAHSMAAFPEEPVPGEFFARFQQMTAGYPAFVARIDSGRVAGFGFLRPFHPATTLRRTAEVTYFILPEFAGQGIGTALLARLVEGARGLGIDNLLATISSANAESLAFHRAKGFRVCGRLERAGRKRGQEFDIVWMQKTLDAVIRRCDDRDFETIYTIINDAAEAYKGVIPADRWHEPYMPKEALCREIESGVRFWGYEQDGVLVGVMGIQDVKDVTLIRHAYVRTVDRGKGIGGKLLGELQRLTTRPILIGTWAAADWAIRFYERHGFRRVTAEEKDRLLKKYWSIPARQVETSVVLADPLAVSQLSSISQFPR